MSAWFSLWYIVGLVMLFWIFPLNKLLLVREFPNSEILFKSVVFIWNKWLQIAPLLIIFVDILPKVGAVPFDQFFLLVIMLLLCLFVLSFKLKGARRNDSLASAASGLLYNMLYKSDGSQRLNGSNVIGNSLIFPWNNY